MGWGRVRWLLTRTLGCFYVGSSVDVGRLEARSLQLDEEAEEKAAKHGQRETTGAPADVSGTRSLVFTDVELALGRAKGLFLACSKSRRAGFEQASRPAGTFTSALGVCF